MTDRMDNAHDHAPAGAPSQPQDVPEVPRSDEATERVVNHPDASKVPANEGGEK